MAALLLFKLIFLFVTSMANIASFLLCQCIAVLTVQIIKLFKIPSLFIEAALQPAENLLRAAVELAGYTIWSITSNLFNVIVSLASWSVAEATSTAAELMERMWMITGELSEILPELYEGVREMVGRVVEDIWSNYKDAVRYVFDHANG